MIEPEADRLATLLADKQQRVVFVESCTAGLAAALLAAVPGISNHLCGSWVTYREECKRSWLGIPDELLTEHTAESAAVSAELVMRGLERTETADFAAAITGHLGPDAPQDLDGVCFIAIAHRRDGTVHLVYERRIQLSTSTRTDRQHEAARCVLASLAEVVLAAGCCGE